jgi:hypothetical protein
MFTANYSFQGGKRLFFFQMGIYGYVFDTHVSLEREPFGLKAGASSTLFPCES